MRVWASVFLCCLVVVIVEAENTYTIAGRVLIDEEGVLYIHLVDEEQFSVPFTGIQEIVVPISSIDLDNGSVAFAFQSIPAGRYAIRVFIDTNGNRKLDRGLFGPREPWGMSWQNERAARIPRFKDIAFPLTEDIADLEIDTRGK